MAFGDENLFLNGAFSIICAPIWCLWFGLLCSLSLESLIFKGVLLFLLDGIYFAPFLTP